MRGVKPEFSTRARRGYGQFRIPQMPIEWLDAGSWRLPSGKALAEFALQAGFLAPLLLKAERFAGPTAPPLTAKPKRVEKEGHR